MRAVAWSVAGDRIGGQCPSRGVHVASGGRSFPAVGGRLHRRFAHSCADSSFPQEQAQFMNGKALTTGIALAALLAVAAGPAAAQAPDRLSAADVYDALAAQGYVDIDDIEFDDGMWEAEARRGDGRRIDLRLDARTGAIYPEDGTTALSMADVEASL